MNQALGSLIPQGLIFALAVSTVSANDPPFAPCASEAARQAQELTNDLPRSEPVPALADAPTPHEPPIFDPRTIERGERAVIWGLAGIGFTGIFNTGWTPPDPHLAVGPDHVVLITNGAIAFFTKDGTLTFQDEIEDSFGFWGEIGASSLVFDPEVIYDPMSGRFFAMAAEAFAPGNRSFALVAVSDDSNPNGTWHKYRFETTALFGNHIDSPNIGVDNAAVYLTADGGGGATTYGILTFDKASLLVGSPPAIQNSFLLPTATESAGLPPVSFDDPPALYMIEHRENSSNTSVRLIALQDPLGSPFWTTIFLPVPSYGNPPEDPPQMGTTVRPETFDARFWSVAYRNGSLWATHHINGNRVLARWYEIAMNGWPDSGILPELVQSGEIDPGPNIRTFFSAITVDEHGNAAMVFARSAPREFISMATAFRYACDPLGTFRPVVIQQTSNGPYTSINRWGDYGAVNVDPTDGLTFWAHHEYAINNSWRTWVQAFTPPFSPADLDHDGTVGILDLLALLAAWGTDPDGPPDFDNDGTVGILDLLTLLANWGECA
ncbi:MAG: hypothetical protein IH983_14955 [Planctomycetes bacterium]|nr:hypothetical protein [Planctomycetota bacterium]